MKRKSDWVKGVEAAIELIQNQVEGHEFLQQHKEAVAMAHLHWLLVELKKHEPKKKGA